MGGENDSLSTQSLEFRSLQLDVKTLQQNRELDRQKFLDFREHVSSNFQSVQKSLGDLQQALTNFISTFPQPREHPPSNPDVLPVANPNSTPQGALKQPGEIFHSPVTVGSAVLHDLQTGRELQLDGSTKFPTGILTSLKTSKSLLLLRPDLHQQLNNKSLCPLYLLENRQKLKHSKSCKGEMLNKIEKSLEIIEDLKL